MKQNLTKMLIKPIVKDEKFEETKEIDEEYEDIFKTMETVSDTPKIKKRKKSENVSQENKKKKKKQVVISH